MTKLLIIGGGPIGLACGLEAQKAGLDYLILEKGPLVNSLYRYPVNMTFFSTSERLEIGGIPFVSNNAKPTRAEALEYYRRVAESRQLPVVPSQVQEVARAGCAVAASVSAPIVSARKVSGNTVGHATARGCRMLMKHSHDT